MRTIVAATVTAISAFAVPVQAGHLRQVNTNCVTAPASCAIPATFHDGMTWTLKVPENHFKIFVTLQRSNQSVSLNFLNVDDITAIKTPNGNHVPVFDKDKNALVVKGKQGTYIFDESTFTFVGLNGLSYHGTCGG